MYPIPLVKEAPEHEGHSSLLSTVYGWALVSPYIKRGDSVIKHRVLWGSLSLNPMPALEGGAVTALVPMSKLRCREVKRHSKRVEELGAGIWLSLGWVCSITGSQALTAPNKLSQRRTSPHKGAPQAHPLPPLLWGCHLGIAEEGEGCAGLTTRTC